MNRSPLLGAQPMACDVHLYLYAPPSLPRPWSRPDLAPSPLFLGTQIDRNHHSAPLKGAAERRVAVHGSAEDARRPRWPRQGFQMARRTSILTRPDRSLARAGERQRVQPRDGPCSHTFAGSCSFATAAMPWCNGHRAPQRVSCCMNWSIWRTSACADA